jgi:hypothetical protein
MTTDAPPAPVGDPPGPDGEIDPRRDLAVPPALLRDSRGGRRAGIAALVGIVALLAVALGVAQLAPPAREGPEAGAPSTAPASGGPVPASGGPASTTAGRTPSPAPGQILAGTPPRLSREALAAAVRDSSLDGRLVFVDAAMRVTPVACPGTRDAGGCVDLEIPGIGVPVRAGDQAIPWRGDPAPGAWLVTVARAGGLVYLGSLVPQREVPGSVGILTHRLLAAELAAPPRTLFEVEGWLVVNPVHSCYRRDPDATPCPTAAPFLAADEPLADGILRSSRGGTVGLAAPVIGMEPGEVVTRGTFLVALPERCDPADARETCDDDLHWLVVARYEPARSVRALVP